MKKQFNAKYFSFTRSLAPPFIYENLIEKERSSYIKMIRFSGRR